MISNDYLLNWRDHSLIGIRVCHWTISKQYQILPKYSPIFRILMTNNSKTKAKIGTLNVPIPIPIELLHFLSKKGQYIVTNNIVDQYAHVWTRPKVYRCDSFTTWQLLWLAKIKYMNEIKCFIVIFFTEILQEKVHLILKGWVS